MKRLNQKSRLLVLAINLIFLIGISKVVFDSWFPPTSEKGMWFYAGLASVLIGYIMSNPFFSPPKDVFAYSVSALISIVALNTIQEGSHQGFDYFLWEGVLLYTSLVLVASIIAMYTKDLEDNTGKKVKDISYLLSSRFGDARVLFSVLYWFALIVFHRYNPREYLFISITWAVVVAVPVVEMLAELTIKLKEIAQRKLAKNIDRFGQIVGYQFPNIILIKHDDDESISFGTPMIVHGDDGKYGVGIALDYIGYADGRWLRAYKLFSNIRPDELGFSGFQHEPGAYKLDIDNPDQLMAQNEIWKRKSNFIGVVAPDSDAAKLKIDIATSNCDLQEGRLIEVFSNEKPVLYQIINGLTKEEIILQKNTRGYVRADAKKIGIWDHKLGNFQVAKWVPQPNSPVFFVDSAPVDPTKDTVGYFPRTSYSVKIADIDKLVTHNTAILGILGIGKSFLAFELIERMIEKGIKVICLDVTNQYAKELGEFYDARGEKRRLDALKRIGPRGKTTVKQNVEEGGSIQQFRKGLKKTIARFLSDRRDAHFIVYNPSEFEVWRQDSKPFQGNASMVSLTPVEIAKVITEVTLETLQDRGITDEARCCIIFEEAHSLIPEWNSVIADGDKSATNGIARAILQGRKYGLGCLVITQRTANVTKSVLNQCNTVFALRLFDSTGMEFLRNYIGIDYSGVLSTLEDRHAVFFGRASSCKDPVLIKLNDREKFLDVFRKHQE